MNQGPYRPNPPEGDAALERLAAEGQHAILEASASRATAAQAEEKKRETNLRVALGVYYGTPLGRASYVMMGGSVLVMIAAVCLLDLDSSSVVFFGFFVVLSGFLVRIVVDPVATRARVAAERAWAASLPFAIDGYFELLAEKPHLACQLVIELRWKPGRTPTPEIVQGVFGVWDAGAKVRSCEGETAGIRSSTFVCGYFPQRDVEPRPTRRVVGRVHRLVDRVLLPLHRSHAIARVSLKCESVPYDVDKPRTVIDMFRDVFGS